jgi:hypothetical protein
MQVEFAAPVASSRHSGVTEIFRYPAIESGCRYPHLSYGIVSGVLEQQALYPENS